MNLLFGVSSISVLLFGTEHINNCSVSLSTDPGGNSFSSDGWRRCLSSFKSFAAQFFFCPLQVLIKNSHFMWKIMFTCTTFLIRNPDTPMSLALELNDLLESLTIMGFLTNLNYSEAFKLLCISYYLLDSSNSFQILWTVLRLTPKYWEIFVLVLP